MSDQCSPGNTQLLLNVTQVATRLGVSVRTVWRWTSGGKLPAPVAMGRCKRWRRKEIDGFIDSL